MVDYSVEEIIMRIDITDVLHKTKTLGGVHFFLYVLESTDRKLLIRSKIDIRPSLCLAGKAIPSR